jgi:hypothetical protein
MDRGEIERAMPRAESQRLETPTRLSRTELGGARCAIASMFSKTANASR